jgi:hypothetical protein
VTVSDYGVTVVTCLAPANNEQRCTLNDTSYTLTNSSTGVVISCPIPDTTSGDIFCSSTDGSSYTWDTDAESTKIEECLAVNTDTNNANYNQIVCTTNVTD